MISGSIKRVFFLPQLNYTDLAVREFPVSCCGSLKACALCKAADESRLICPGFSRMLFRTPQRSGYLSVIAGLALAAWPNLLRYVINLFKLFSLTALFDVQLSLFPPAGSEFK